MKVRIHYDQEKCIGVQNCIVSKHFSFNGEKAELKNAKKDESGMFYLDAELNDEMITAAEHCPVNAIGITDAKTGKDIVKNQLEMKKGVTEITAEYDDMKEFVLDPKGYFLIRVDKEKKLIEIAHCGKRNAVEVIIRGKKPIEIYQMAIKQGLITRMDHAAYLGRELQKAYIALQLHLEYIQDDEIVFKDAKK